MRRLISHSEISTAYDCQFKWDLMYGGHVALGGGVVLKPHAPAARLRAGSAWGKAVAAFHRAADSASGVPGGDPARHGGVGRFDPGTVGPAPSEPLIVRYAIALTAVNASLDEDATQMREHGFYDETEHHDMAVRLGDVLWHYVTTTEPLAIHSPEFELQLPIPSRSGRGVSNRYSFHGYLDGLVLDEGRLWLAEYKFRDKLTEYRQLVRSRQLRRYVWAAERQLGVQIAGVISDERLSFAPKPARWVKAKRKGEGVGPLDEKGYGRVPSHAVDQLTTEDLYREACLEAGVDADPNTAAALGSRSWQSRHRIPFRRSEIEEAGRELVSAGQLIALLDSGVIHPVRNPAPWRCNGCAFEGICDTPDDLEVIETNFDLRPPKRDREPLLEGSRS